MRSLFILDVIKLGTFFFCLTNNIITLCLKRLAKGFGDHIGFTIDNVAHQRSIRQK